MCEIKEHISFEEHEGIVNEQDKLIQVEESISSYLQDDPVMKSLPDEDELQQPFRVTLMQMKQEIDTEELQVSDPLSQECMEDCVIPLPNSEASFEIIVKEESPIFCENESENAILSDSNEFFHLSSTSNMSAASLIANEKPSSENSGSKKDPTSSCKLCGKWFPSARSLKRHMERHSKKKPYKCDQCPAAYTDSSTLRRHRQSSHVPAVGDSPVRPFACASCDRRYASLYELKAHQRSHSGERPFACADCDARFTQRPYLVAHARVAHGTPHETARFVCDTCGKRFAHRTSLRTHAQTHVAVKAHGCEVCGKTFATAWKLKKHIEALHAENPEGPIRPHYCDVCGASYRYRAGLRLHIRSAHLGDRPFCCEECGATFCDGSYLAIHQRSHSSVRPLKCTECSMSFKYHSNLHRHRIAKHKEDVKEDVEEPE